MKEHVSDAHGQEAFVEQPQIEPEVENVRENVETAIEFDLEDDTPIVIQMDAEMNVPSEGDNVEGVDDPVVADVDEEMSQPQIATSNHSEEGNIWDIFDNEKLLDSFIVVKYMSHY